MRSAFGAITKSAATDVVIVPRHGAGARHGRIPARANRLEAWHDASYRFTAMKSKDSNKKKPRQRNLGIAVTGKDAPAVRRGIAHGEAIGKAVALARDLGNLPANVCTPTYLVQQARDVGGARHRRLRVEVLNEPQMRRLGMGSLLSVTAGSDEPARFIISALPGRGEVPRRRWCWSARA